MNICKINLLKLATFKPVKLIVDNVSSDIPIGLILWYEQSFWAFKLCSPSEVIGWALKVWYQRHVIGLWAYLYSRKQCTEIAYIKQNSTWNCRSEFKPLESHKGAYWDRYFFNTTLMTYQTTRSIKKTHFFHTTFLLNCKRIENRKCNKMSRWKKFESKFISKPKVCNSMLLIL